MQDLNSSRFGTPRHGPDGSVIGSGRIAAVTDEEGDPLEVTVRWATSNPAIATVDETGLVTGVFAGTTEIVATYAGVSGMRTITVTQN